MSSGDVFDIGIHKQKLFLMDLEDHSLHHYEVLHTYDCTPLLQVYLLKQRSTQISMLVPHRYPQW